MESGRCIASFSMYTPVYNIKLIVCLSAHSMTHILDLSSPCDLLRACDFVSWQTVSSMGNESNSSVTFGTLVLWEGVCSSLNGLPCES
jgi:hypothetical protein